jgi:nitrate reductase NapE component
MEKRQRNLLIAFAFVVLVLLPLFSWALAAIVGG